MFLIDPILTHLTLTWTQHQPTAHPLPSHIQRTTVQTPSGLLELLISEPRTNLTSTTPPTQPPILFLHGGFGHASVWLEWLTYLHNHNYPSHLYALSLRGHGTSHCPNYKTQVHGTTFEDMLSDAVHVLEHISDLCKQSASATQSTRLPILIGHSSGGGIAQALLSNTYTHTTPNSPSVPLSTRASALCLVDSIPHYGSLDIYWNWLLHDPFFPLRSLFHLSHPSSPLSTSRLVQTAFFGRHYPLSRAAQFMSWFPGYESTGWPMAMFGGTFGEWWGGRGCKWLDVDGIVDGLEGVERSGDRVCVVVGREDMMYRPWMWERICGEYGRAIGKVRVDKRVSGEIENGNVIEEPIEMVTVESANGVRLVLVAGAGHHVQNDVYCDETAEAVLRWANQV